LTIPPTPEQGKAIHPEQVMLEASIFVVFPFCMVFAAVSDMLSMTIANRVAVLLVATFALVAPFTGMDWATYGWHFAAGGIVLAATFGLFALDGMGGGDAKLMSATAVFLGFNMQLVEYLVVSAFLGGVLTFAILFFRSSALAVFTSRNAFLRHFADDGVGVPYGIALGIGGLIAYPSSPLMVWALERLASS
jgi:prepilin peptidase CpaA